MKIRMVMALLMGLLASAPVSADGPKWTAIYGGIHGGIDLTSVDMGIGGSGGLGVNGLSANGEAYGIHGGIDYVLPGTMILVGIAADWTWSNASFDINLGGFNILSAGLDESWAVTGRVGYTMGRAMPYLLGGYTQAKASASLLGNSIGSETLNGWVAGAGVEFLLDYGLSLAGEYRYTRFDDLSYFGGLVEFSPERHEVRAALRYRFNAF